VVAGLRAWRIGAGVVLAGWGLLACAGRAAPSAQGGPSPEDNRAVLGIVRGALELEAAGFPTDTLFAPGAQIVANGAERHLGQRFAGVSPGGRLTVTQMWGEVHSTTAWAVAAYTWRADDGLAVETGFATFLLERDLSGGSWRIRHVHSSVLPPWEYR
jgi:hypothetical protein